MLCGLAKTLPMPDAARVPLGQLPSFEGRRLSVHCGVFSQTMNILIVNQSVIDMCASFFTLLTAAVEVDGTRMSRDSVYLGSGLPHLISS